MRELLLVVHVLAVITLIGLVLLQNGKGSDISAAFGSGASNTMFGSAGTVSFLVKLTAVIAAIFFITSISLGGLAMRDSRKAAQQTTIENSLPTQQ